MDDLRGELLVTFSSSFGAPREAEPKDARDHYAFAIASRHWSPAICFQILDDAIFLLAIAGFEENLITMEGSPSGFIPVEPRSTTRTKTYSNATFGLAPMAR